MRTFLIFVRLSLMLGLAVTAGCAGTGTPANPPGAAPARVPSLERGVFPDGLKTPALIAFDQTTGALVYWPTDKGPSYKPITFTASLGIYDGYAMAANGDTLIIANYSPAEILTYNVKTKATTTLTDSYGGPIDVAVDKKSNIYALNENSVAVFPAGSGQPSELICSYISNAQAIAVDNEGDVFVNGYGPGGFMGVVEFPQGSGNCTKLQLRAERGYIGGVGIDPKTDDLIVVDDPDLCAGGLEGRMIIYPKPYHSRTARRHDLGASYCSGTFRLDANSKRIYVSDATVSDGYPLIDVRSYPRGKGGGTYGTGYGDSTGGFTTIPNVLPN